ncbi:hypothetical protein D3C84_746280 [compost metagenome]
MTDIRFYGPQPDRLLRLVRTQFAPGGLERINFDRIAQQRAGAVGLDVTDLRGEPGTVDTGQQRRLSRRVRRGQGVGPPAMIFTMRQYHTMNGIPILLGPTQGLKQEASHAFCADIAVGRLIETGTTKTR